MDLNKVSKTNLPKYYTFQVYLKMLQPKKYYNNQDEKQPLSLPHYIELSLSLSLFSLDENNQNGIKM